MTVNFNKQAAFTLAETLITLTIIGIIAALTIPNLMQKYQEHVTVNKVKSTYAILSNAYKMALAENGPTSDWGLSLKEGAYNPEENNFILQKLAPYLRLQKNCGITNNKECWTQNGPCEYLDGTVYKQFPSTGATAILANGVYFWVYKTPQTTSQGSIGIISIQIDPRKKDIYGRTMFHFILAKNGLEPYGLKKHVSDISKNCSLKTSATGHACTAWIIYKGNMDYLHKDIKWDE